MILTLKEKKINGKMIKIHSGATFIRIFVMKLLWKKFTEKSFLINVSQYLQIIYPPISALFSFPFDEIFFSYYTVRNIIFNILLFIYFAEKLFCIGLEHLKTF